MYIADSAIIETRLYHLVRVRHSLLNCCYTYVLVWLAHVVVLCSSFGSTIFLSLPCLFSDVVKKAIFDAFQISEGKECRLWHRYMTNSYEQVKGKKGREQGRSESSVGWGRDRETRLWSWFTMYCIYVHTYSTHSPLHLTCMFSSQSPIFSLPLPPSHEMMTCFRSQGSTPVRWWFWKWRRTMEHGPERPM